MTATDMEKVEINTTVIANQRLTTIVLVLLIILLALLVIGILAGFLMMNGGMMNGGITSACLNMMRNVQSP